MRRMVASLATKLEEAKGVAKPAVVSDAEGSGVWPWADERVRAILGPAAYPHTLAGENPGLIFAMDATASREPAWQRALHVQASMFSAFSTGLRVQLVWFRGHEFRASAWKTNAMELADEMQGVTCRAGKTQIGAVLKHAYSETDQGRLAALVYVGDCMEERREALAALACKLRSRNVKAFMFLEGQDGWASASFYEIAEITGGAYCSLSENSAAELKDLLAGVAAYAANGREGLLRLAAQRPAAGLLLTQIK